MDAANFTRVCDVCGISYEPARNADGSVRKTKHNVCGKVCASRKYAGRSFVPVRRRCAHCAAEYIAKKGDQKYCSVRCKEQSQNKELRTLRCAHCGEAFKQLSPTHTKFCSRKCKQEHCNQYETTKVARRACAVTRSARIRGADVYERIDPIAVFERDRWRCHLCGKRLKLKHRGTTRQDAPELDHIIPVSVGGSHAMSNVACSCRRCNNAKRAKPLGQLRLEL